MAVSGTLPSDISPSVFDDSGIQKQARYGQIPLVVNGAISAVTLDAGMLPYRCRIVGVRIYRAVAGSGVGAGGSTDIQVSVQPFGSDTAGNILSASVEFEQSAGDDLWLDGVLNTALDNWDGEGLFYNFGAIVRVVIAAIEAGATPPSGLVASLLYQAC